MRIGQRDTMGLGYRKNFVDYRVIHGPRLRKWQDAGIRPDERLDRLRSFTYLPGFDT